MTAVEFLIEQICGEHRDAWKEEIKQALELEKQQIINAYLQKRRILNISKSIKLCVDAEQYFNETYKKLKL